MGPTSNPLGPLTKIWWTKIKKAHEYKQRVFGDTAAECMEFFNGAHDFMYGGKGARKGIGMYVDSGKKIKTTFKMTTNKVAELVDRFGPAMYFNNPHRQVNPRKPIITPDALPLLGGNPQMMQFAMQQILQSQQIDKVRSQFLEGYLNYTPNELDLHRHSREGITEVLIKGMCGMWTEVYQPRGSQQRFVGSFHDNFDRTLVDPDCEKFREAEWVARICVHPTWMVEDEYGWPRGSLKGNLESSHRQSVVENDRDLMYMRSQGKTNDMMMYAKIYSRMGMGNRLSGSDLDESMEQFGDNVYLVVAPDVEYPLNLPPQLVNQDLNTPGVLDQILQNIKWPIPFHAANEWPVSELGFTTIPGIPYAMSHMKKGLGELRFINWCMSFLADKVRLTSRDLIAIAEHAEEDIETKIKDGDDLEVVRFKTSMNKKISELVQYIQHPPMNRDILDVINLAMSMFDKRVGLTELLYGISNQQMRSAEEASLKRAMTTNLIDDMSREVEAWQTRIARKEGMAVRWNIGPADFAPIVGEQITQPQMNFMTGQMMPPQLGPMTQLWAQFVFSPPDSSPDALSRVVHEFEYRIEADSLRRPNRERDVTNMDQAMQTLFSPLMQFYQGTGNSQQLNALITDWAKVRDLDAGAYLFPAFQPPPVAPAQQPQQPKGAAV